MKVTLPVVLALAALLSGAQAQTTPVLPYEQADLAVPEGPVDALVRAR